MPNFKLEAKVMVWLSLGPAIVGGIFAMLMPPFFRNPLAFFIVAIAMIGTWLILKSKLKLKARTKLPFEWGSAEMTANERYRYWFGYLLLVGAVALAVLLRLF